jgi:hypothetical protein
MFYFHGEEGVMDELLKNREAYNSMRDELEKDHLGRIALFHDGKLIRVYNDRDDAYDIGLETYGAGNYSIKRIGSPSQSLGAATMYLKPIPLR